jgi:hypothetical protein
MSKGLSDLQATIQSYSGSQDAVNNYVQNYDNAFFQNWKEKVDLASQKLESGRKVADGIGEAYIGGKALSYSVKAFRNKFFNKDNNNPSDEDGNNEGGDEDVDPKGGDDSATGNADDVDDVGGETLGDGTEVVEPDLGAETNVGGESGFELQDMNTTSQPSQTGTDGSPEETSFAEQTEAPQPSTQVADEPSSGLQQTDIQNQIQDTDPEAGTTPTDPEAGTTPAETTTAETTTAETTAEDTGADLLTTTATETGAETGSAVLGALGVGAEALGPLGLLAGIGIGLYELFHHPSKPPPAPKPLVASSKGEMVLPSYDAVIDTPASMTAF